MKTTQKFTPKYWICHDKTTDDVFIMTADKSKDNSIEKYIKLFGHYLDDDHVCELMEISKVGELK